VNARRSRERRADHERADLQRWAHGGTVRYRHHRPSSYTFGYLHPEGNCPHDPPCSPAGSKPFGGNEPGSRCKPQPKQQLAHISLADIVFYGGAVGGGKSEYAIVEAVTLALEHPGVKVAIFRRTLKELDQELVGRLILLTWAGDKNVRGPNGKLFAKYNSQQHKLTLWNGSEVWLCYCDRESDVYKYQSFQIIGLFLDESSHFTEFMVKYLITRVRSARRGVPKVIRLTSNPGHVGHGWHKRWFIKPTPAELGAGRLPPAPFEIWRPQPAHAKIRPDQVPTRQFIPAWFHDNLALAADPDYLASKVYGARRRQGEAARRGRLGRERVDDRRRALAGAAARDRGRCARCSRVSAPRRGQERHPVARAARTRPGGRRSAAHIFGSLDYGYGAPASIHLHAALPGGHTRTFLEFYGARKRDVKQAEILKRMLERETFADGTTPLIEGLQWVVYDPQMAGSRQEMGLAKTIIEVYQDAMPRVQFLAGAAGRQARALAAEPLAGRARGRARRRRGGAARRRAPISFAPCPRCRGTRRTPTSRTTPARTTRTRTSGRFFEARPHAPRPETMDPYKDLDPMSRAHQHALDQALDPKDKDSSIARRHTRDQRQTTRLLRKTDWSEGK
jgi:hypothetical protein